MLMLLSRPRLSNLPGGRKETAGRPLGRGLAGERMMAKHKKTRMGWRGEIIRNVSQITKLERSAHKAANATLRQVRQEVRGFRRGTEFLWCAKFDRTRTSACEKDRKLTVLEQANQTMTWLAGLCAVRVLLKLHPEAKRFEVCYPTEKGFDIVGKGVRVRAEVFATKDTSVRPRLRKVCARLCEKSPRTRNYIFFCSPRYAKTHRQKGLERDRTKVWSVEVKV